MNVPKDEAYWIKWLQDHDEQAMINEILALGDEIAAAKVNGWTDDRIVKAGFRQNALVSELLEFHDVNEVAEETGFPPGTIIAMHTMHLTRQPGSN